MKVNISVAASALDGSGKGRGGILWRREGKTQEVEEKTRHVITQGNGKFETMAPHDTTATAQTPRRRHKMYTKIGSLLLETSPRLLGLTAVLPNNETWTAEMEATVDGLPGLGYRTCYVSNPS